jgi:hypothetical protein
MKSKGFYSAVFDRIERKTLGLKFILDEGRQSYMKFAISKIYCSLFLGINLRPLVIRLSISRRERKGSNAGSLG